jgi:hypothetical protein
MSPHLLLLTVPCLALLASLAMAADEPTKTADEYIQVEIKGKLKTGLMAIGGETTGYAIVAKGATWELEFGANAELRKRAEALDDRMVIVKGKYELRRGVEVKQRHIVTVTNLMEAAK